MSSGFTVWLVASVLALSQPSLQSNANIELTLRSGTVNVGGTAVFICNVTGTEVYNFTWLYNGAVRVIERTEPFTTITRNGGVSTLSIHFIPSEEAGNYTCIANTSNTNSSAPLQTSIMLRVKASPEVTTVPVQHVVQGDDATLQCNITGHSLITVLWRRGTKVVSSIEIDSLPMTSLFEIKNAAVEDAGIYECVATSNTINYQATINLTVFTVPVIHPQPSAITEVQVGQQAILHCNATGIDTPAISWRLEGVDVESYNNSRLTSLANGSLVINNTEITDSRNYSCVARNRAGNTSCTMILVVNGPPVLLMPPQNTTVLAGSTVELSCSYLANPNDGRVLWEQNGNLIGLDDQFTSEKYQISATNGSLVIRDTRDLDTGEYRCTVSNSMGNVSANAILTVFDEPNIPQRVMATGIAGTQSYSISWMAPMHSDTTRPVINYLIKLRLDSDEGTAKIITVPHNQTQFMFTDLLPGNSYDVSIAASNQVGVSSYSTLVTFSTKPTAPALEFFNVTKTDADEVQLIFTWKIRYDGGSPIDHFAIQYQDIQGTSEDTWRELFTPELDVNMEMYKSVSFPPEGSYVFRVAIKNTIGLGFSSHSAKIDIPKAIPGQPSKPAASDITTDSITILSNLEFMGTGIVKQYVIRLTGDSEETRNFPVINKTRSSRNKTFTIDGLDADSTYRFQVAAMNDVGLGPFSELSDEITTEKDGSFVYIIVGAVGGFVIIVAILLTTLFVCYMWNKRMKAHKHQISINEVPDKRRVQIMSDDSPDDSTGFMPNFNKPLPRYPYNSSSDSTILSPIERSRSLQYRNDGFGKSGSTISYGSSVATRSASLLQAKQNNYSIPRNPMYGSATLISYGSASQFSTMENRQWSPPLDHSQRERRSPSSTYYSDTMGKITNMATDV